MGVAFIVGSTLMFAGVFQVGRALGVATLPLGYRYGVAAAGLLALAAVDLSAIRRGTFCPLGWRRQTPKSLLRSKRLTLTAAVWGFDTGLAVTTFRVAAVTWGALAFVALNLSPWWTGIGYGVAFVVPLCFQLKIHRAPSSNGGEGRPKSAGMEHLFRQRPLLQLLSAVFLFGGAVILVAGGV